MFHCFQSEAEFARDLNQLPLYLRMKLDLTGVKLSLKQWLAFAFEERRILCHLPIDNDEELVAFVEYLSFLCNHYHASAAQRFLPLSPALWNTAHLIPEPALELSRKTGQAIVLDEWRHWQFHERYALYKTAGSKNEPEKFFAILSELRQRRTES